MVKARRFKPFTPLNNDVLLCSIAITTDSNTDKARYPFCLPLIRNIKKITFDHPITFFVGENGSGKSTILEAIAHAIGLGPEGGSKHIAHQTTHSFSDRLGNCMKLTWSYKPNDAYFFKAESFFNIANYLDSIPDGARSYGGKSLHHQSHGESFFSFFNNRLSKTGIYIFDEPEAALSPQRQLAFLKVIHDITRDKSAQCIIATHSPILLAYPNAPIYTCDGDQLQKITYKETEHYQVTKQFLDAPELYLKQLFAKY